MVSWRCLFHAFNYPVWQLSVFPNDVAWRPRVVLDVEFRSVLVLMETCLAVQASLRVNVRKAITLWRTDPVPGIVSLIESGWAAMSGMQILALRHRRLFKLLCAWLLVDPKWRFAVLACLSYHILWDSSWILNFTFDLSSKLYFFSTFTVDNVFKCHIFLVKLVVLMLQILNRGSELKMVVSNYLDVWIQF